MKKSIRTIIIGALCVTSLLTSGCAGSSGVPNNQGTNNYEPSSKENPFSSISSQPSPISPPDNVVITPKKKHFFALPYDGIAVINKNGGIDLKYVDGCEWEKVDGSYFWKNICSISAGFRNLFGLKTNGTVAAVGNNEYNQCDVSSWNNVIHIDANIDHTVALRADGTAYAAGKNTDGRCNVSGWTDLADISAGYTNTVGLKRDGTVLVVGENKYGQNNVTDWTNIKAVSAGHFHTVGLKDDGTVVATGSNTQGQCNVADWRDIVDVQAGKLHTVGLKKDGTVVAAGHDEYGECDVSSWRDVKEIFVEKKYTVGITNSGELLVAGLCFYDKDISEKRYFLNNYKTFLEKGLEFAESSSEPSEHEESSKPEESSKTEESSESEAKPTPSQINAAYRTVVNDLIKKYGKPEKYQSQYKGTAVVRLFDFDGDGVDELYCAYSENKYYYDKQEIWQYQNGKAVSLYKAEMNNMGTSVEPFVMIVKKDGKLYALVDSRDDVNGNLSCKWIGVNNNKAYVASTSANFYNEDQIQLYISSGMLEPADILGDTITVMKQFGCNTAGMISEKMYSNQVSIYNSYIQSRKWADFSKEIGPAPEYMDSTQAFYYDFNNDGILEMWLTAKNRESSMYGTLDVFCTIKNNKVEKLLEAGTTGGTSGGDRIVFTYNEIDDTLNLSLSFHSSGFGGYAGALTVYDFSGSKITKKLEAQYITYNDNTPPSYYKINGKNVTENEYHQFLSRYKYLNYEETEELIFWRPPTVSLREMVNRILKPEGQA